MDVSIAVSLIRGQMGTVVERAVNGAVETVLAEMLKVVGVKFEELKAQVALMKRDITALQREKALKEKENDNIRAKLRYTELKLKYYRQGVEEELQQRASTSTLVCIHPSSITQTQRGGGAGHSPAETQTRTSQECTSSESTHGIRARCHSDVGVAGSDSTDLLLPVSLSVNAPAESLESSTERDESIDTAVARPPVQVLTLEPGKLTGVGPMSPDGSTQADSSTLPPSAPQVKQEVQQEEEEKEEVICIKGEPEEEQEVTATLLLDCQVQQCQLSETEVRTPVSDTKI
ncbi:hypothetical protein INR49_026999 [Caranx melampygus]|nr:hypothetical protein INR49_026999 [Caranx melampygus]